MPENRVSVKKGGRRLLEIARWMPEGMKEGLVPPKGILACGVGGLWGECVELGVGWVVRGEGELGRAVSGYGEGV